MYLSFSSFCEGSRFSEEHGFDMTMRIHKSRSNFMSPDGCCLDHSRSMIHEGPKSLDKIPMPFGSKDIAMSIFKMRHPYLHDSQKYGQCFLSGLSETSGSQQARSAVQRSTICHSSLEALRSSNVNLTI